MRSITFDQKANPPITVLQTALGADRKLSLRDETRLRRLWRAYELNSGRSDLIAPSPAYANKLGDTFRKAYEQTYDGKRLYFLRQALLALVQNRCPRCGGSRPGTLDHHLPKKSFAEYAVLPMNLVGCCQECNGKKSASAAGTPEEAFLHPYFDPIPAVPFIRATVHVSEEGVQVTLEFDDEADIEDAVLKARMKNQFTTVDVNARVASEITEFLSEHAGRLEDAGAATGDHVRNYLLAVTTRADKNYTVGSWQSAILRALAAQEAYCEGGWRTNLPKANIT
jgi:5-methylcytosine-specific restriction endonuclease McrA